MTDDELGVSRRGLLAAGGGAVVGGAAGVLYFGDVLGGGGGGGPESISATEPNSDGEATLGELRYLIESFDERGVTLDVQSFTYTEGEVNLAYTSAAADASGYERWRVHLAEVGHLLWSYAQYVVNNSSLSWPPAGQESTTTSGGNASSGTASRPTTVPAGTVPEDGRVALRIFATVENPYSTPEDSETPAQADSYAVRRQWVGNWLVGA